MRLWLAVLLGISVRASWYGESHRGELMANGQPFNPDAFTCATWDFPIGSVLIVSAYGKDVVVKVTDRGPSKRIYNRGVKLDLSRAAFEELRPSGWSKQEQLDLGIIKVKIQRVR